MACFDQTRINKFKKYLNSNGKNQLGLPVESSLRLSSGEVKKINWNIRFFNTFAIENQD